ncbi:MAG: protein kinase domain-containing protein [Thermoanaerobaculia bacterium]
MTLAVGTRLGPYEILSPLGAGGMGEVYRARDTRLERTVAIKVLPSHLSSSAEVRQRFEREAKTISQLSHPHICALHDIGREGDTDYLVMEYLEGETLSARLAKGALALEQTLRYGVEMADALDKAHRQGIVHRDLKPGNVMLTKSGVKLLDFGLAKAMAPPAPRGSLTALPTQQGLTQEGTILGTFQYMAPEQLEGKETDVRSDIFAFGAVLYEMATGRKAFSGTSQASLITAIMSTDPAPISAIQPMTPPALDRVVKTCLAKDPEDRWQTAHDVRLELKWIAEGGSLVGLPAPVAARRKRAERLVWGFAGLAAGAISAAFLLPALARRHSAQAQPATSLSILPPPEAPLALYGQTLLALSPDGRSLVYVAERRGGRQLYLRPLNRFETVPIRDSDGASNPFFSPDSRWLGFSAGSVLKKVLLEGGTPQALCAATDVRSVSWGPRDTILFSAGTAGLWSVSADGGSPRKLTESDAKKGEVGHGLPDILPGGEAALFTVFQGVEFRIEVLSLKTGTRRKLGPGARPRYVPSGHLVFSRGTSLLAAPFDLEKLELTGPAVSVMEGVLLVGPFNTPLFSISDNGTLVYASGTVEHSLVWVDRRGTVAPLSLDVRAFEEPRLSPDGSRVAVTIRDAANPDVWVCEVARGTWMRLTFEAGEDETPIWTPDGRRVTYGSGRPGRPREAFWKPADGSGAEERLFESSMHPHMSSWSPDGRALLFTEYDPATRGDIWVLSLEGSRSVARPLLKTPAHERAARFSPDGRWFVYVSDESGRDEVYVQPFPGPGGRWQISYSGGAEPVWSRDGRELFYRSAEKMMAAGVTTQPTFSAGSPRVLFEGDYVTTRRGEAAYDVSPDGQRFLMVRRDPRSAPVQLNVVLNWFDDLQRRVPTGKR